MARFAGWASAPGKKFDAQPSPPRSGKRSRTALRMPGRAYEAVEKKLASGERSSGDLFGAREYLKNNYLYRMTAAVDGIYGNSKEEAIYPMYVVDSTGDRIDTREIATRCALRRAAAAGQRVLVAHDVPDAVATARRESAQPLPDQFPDAADLKRDPDGGVTLHIQNVSPGKDKEPNWLPAPNGPFLLALRLYWPKPEALSGAWKKPPLQRLS